MRKRIYTLIQSVPYSFAMIALIVVSIVPLAFHTETDLFQIIDACTTSAFIFDYVARWMTADYKYGSRSVLSFVRYPFSFMAVIDLLSVLPSFTLMNSCFKVLRMARMFRALRVLRVLKAARYSRSLQIILRVFRRSREALLTVGTLALAYILICALVILNVEPESFENFYDAVYWACVSLTTMGYGDIYPVTAVGRFFTMISSFLGIAIVALPAGIITAGYMAEVEHTDSDTQAL